MFMCPSSQHTSQLRAIISKTERADLSIEKTKQNNKCTSSEHNIGSSNNVGIFHISVSIHSVFEPFSRVGFLYLHAQFDCMHKKNILDKLKVKFQFEFGAKIVHCLICFFL